jgi:hypothetical protein
VIAGLTLVTKILTAEGTNQKLIKIELEVCLEKTPER